MSKEVILKAENISKQYRLGSVGTGTISHDLNRWWASIRGKDDPFLKVGETNDRTSKGNSDYVWALQDINFEVQRGEVLGIIGKNGAGKSTLLKILSRVTSPTTGTIKTKGRIASLLEVGTGFHGEMTGRENIYLNGSILGMTKAEISSKIDEIIEFSGCERYIDTPVKRYSSGMTVRLAFAVAAHLEPEILVVDEVLAVGDAEFQKKAIGKMKDIAEGEGRTVLFVSHNMAAVQSLCTRGMVMNNGKIEAVLPIDKAVEKYLNLNSAIQNFDAKKFENIELLSLKILDQGSEINVVQAFQPVVFQVRYKYLNLMPIQTHVEFFIKDEFGTVVTSMSSWLNSQFLVPKNGIIEVNCSLLNGFSLVQGTYSVDLQISDSVNQVYYDIFEFEIINTPHTGYVRHVRRERFGNVYTPNKWEIIVSE
ncbi:ABC transporter ATP-binding protein [Flavobacterium sp. SM15]|uniref:ABC transporter ATP-binding protein n=1 Tax=Flavobacterium sp. SM15 TaxID=2908005 RepID=UPI001EDA8C70|nr:ABC transporter ATP-binding protein [Flavobacterium sp. SM15]MCG2611270.1 ABC transporter ATP-binding protein [Flavobacterium sp. SM15]